MLDLIDKIIGSIRDLKEDWYFMWLSTNKPFGFEVIDIRLGGLIARFETAKIRFNEFIKGTIPDIPELSSSKLPLLKNENGQFECMNSWAATATVSRLV